MQTATFRINPSFVCNRAREYVLENDVPKALLVLGDSFSGLDLASSYAILKGDSVLVQDGDRIVLRPDASEEAAEHRSTLASNFAHVIRMKGQWYEPYAVVEDLGENDKNTFYKVGPAVAERAFQAQRSVLRGANLDRSSSDRNLAEAARPLHYADEPTKDVIVYLPMGYYNDGRVSLYSEMRRGNPVLFRKCETPPPAWIEGAKDPLEAAQKGLEEGAVIRTGHRALYDRSATDDRGQDPFRKERVIPALRSRREASIAEERSAKNQEAEERRLSAFAPPGDEEEPVVDIAKVIEDLRVKILAQAERQGGFVEVQLGDRTIRAPKAPLERWALAPLKKDSLLPEWDAVSPPDFKIQRDNRDHTDWMIAAGVDPFLWHHWGDEAKALRKAGYELMERIQSERMRVAHPILTAGGSVSGRVWTPDRGGMPEVGDIVVLPNAAPKWLEHVAAALGNRAFAGVIVEEGGAVAHLVNVLREKGVLVVRWPGAIKALAQAESVHMDGSDGAVEVLSYRANAPVVDSGEDADESPRPGM